MKKKNESTKQMNELRRYYNVDIYRGDIDRDFIEWIPFRIFIRDFHIEPNDIVTIEKYLLEMDSENGSIYGKMIYGKSHEIVYRKLKNIKEEL